MENLNQLSDAQAIKTALYDKELNTKKAVLDYIELIKKNRDTISEEGMKNSHDYIEDCIDEMAKNIKSNTVLYLKNELKSKLGKYDKKAGEQEIDYFIEFFKEAYPDGKRRKSYTWVLADSTKMTEEQILHTLKYINAWCLKGNRLTAEQKSHILRRIETITYKGTLKYINQVRSLEGVAKSIHFKIVKTNKGYTLER
ncbi:MAG: hypothetical protein AB9856_08755 [Cellulosilyticaceae bacterium]